MTYTIATTDQRTPAWEAARLGRLTGSRAADMLAEGRYGVEALTRRLYRKALVYERFTGVPTPPGPVTRAMRRGIALEAQAIAAYEQDTGARVTRTGFLQSTTCLAGCSPDGLLEEGAGVLEVKCPDTATHTTYLMDGRLPPAHRAQVRHNVWITGARFCDFVSYNDRVDPRWQVFVVRVEAAELELPAYEDRALTFLEDVETELRTIVRLLKPTTLMTREVNECADSRRYPRDFLAVHHDVKPQHGQTDNRRSPHRASGGGIFSIADALLSVVKKRDGRVMMTPCAYKFGTDPEPFCFTIECTNGPLPSLRLCGADMAASDAAASSEVDIEGEVLDCLLANPGRSGALVATTIRRQKNAVLAAIRSLKADGRLNDGNEVVTSTASKSLERSESSKEYASVN